MTDERTTKKRSPRRSHFRDWYLTILGTLLLVGEFIHAEVLGGTFHNEFLIGALALMGIGITQWGDKR